MGYSGNFMKSTGREIKILVLNLNRIPWSNFMSNMAPVSLSKTFSSFRSSVSRHFVNFPLRSLKIKFSFFPRHYGHYGREHEIHGPFLGQSSPKNSTVFKKKFSIKKESHKVFRMFIKKCKGKKGIIKKVKSLYYHLQHWRHRSLWHLLLSKLQLGRPC